ncbi:MAG: thermonuclease family protein [Flavitalea sp.]
MKLLLILYLGFILPSCTIDTPDGKVVGIIDGDTFDMMVNGKKTRVRMFGIDAPERRQDYYQKSKQALSEMIYGEIVRIDTKSRDRYKRTLAEVYVGNKWINREMVMQGMAWHFTRYSSDIRISAAEKEARNAKRGLWSMKAVAPWEFRSRKQVVR